MNKNEKIDYIKALAPDLSSVGMTDEGIAAYLELSESSILERRYPYGIPDGIEFPARYDRLACEIAVAIISKIGAEGEISHTENGISRSYATGFIPKDMLQTVIPLCGVPK